MYTNREGKRCNINYLTKRQQGEMLERGWRLKLAEYNETAQELHDRLSKSYGQVKIYYSTTRIRGLHKNYAFVKR